MKKIFNFSIGVLLQILILVSCQAVGPRPSVWIDQPLDGSKFPVNPITIQAHASSLNGVSLIEFFVMDLKVGEQSVGGANLENASIVWNPPGPGEYKLAASAVDAAGNIGGKASVDILITGVVETPQMQETQTPSPSVTSSNILCTQDELVAPNLVSPEDGASIDREPILSWSYPESSCNPQSYKIDISPNAGFSDVSLGFGTLDFYETSRQWPLKAGECYYWRVRAIVSNFDGPNSAGRSFCIEKPPATIVFPAITINEDANCRSGPGTAYEAIDFAAKGSILSIEGRNEENTWYWVKPTEGADYCWISAVVGAVSGDPGKSKVISAPPLPLTVITATLDTIPPEITDIQVVPSVIAASGPIICPGYVEVTITVKATDNSGALDVYVEIPENSVNIKLVPLSNNKFQISVAPGNILGQKNLIIHAIDKAGNETSANWANFTVIPCLQ